MQKTGSTAASDTGHTPGPWREGRDGNLRVYGPDGQGDASGLIAEVFKGRANVRLIAAAPDLLAALKQLMKAYESVLPGLAKIAVQDYALINDAPVAADRAIAKAEGK